MILQANQSIGARFLTRRFAALSMIGVCSAALLASQAQAQQAATAGGGEVSVFGDIVVTARKRTETLQQVPLSVQAFSAEALERSNISDVSALADFTPGLQLFENVDRGYGQVFIRGLQNTPPVGDTTRELASIFIDGVFFTGGVSAINTDNIERVEVIRGPQSALFGRSTFSGAINFITKTPGREFGASLNLLAATDDEYEVSASLEGPIIPDVLSARVSGRFRDFGGQYTYSLNGDPLGEEQDISASGQLYFTPGESFSAKITVSYLEQKDGPAASSLVSRLPNHNFTAPNGSTFYAGVVRQDSPIAQNRFPTNDADILGLTTSPLGFQPLDSLPGADRLGIRRNGLDRDYFFASLNLNYEFAGGHTLSYLGGYSDEKAARLWDFELSPEDNYYGQRNTDSTSHSHELKIASPDDSRLRWLAGLFYLNQELYERDPGSVIGVGFPFFPVKFAPGQAAVLPGPRVIVDRTVDNYAVFGSLAYDLSDQLTVSLEGRWQKDKLEDVLDPVAGTTLDGSTSAFLPRAIIEYSASPDVLIYASAAKGLRPTTINSQFTARSDAEKAIIRAEFPELTINELAPPESIWTFELGAKTTLLDGRAIFNINGYYSDWKDSQDLRSLLADVNGDGVPDSTLVTVNGADIEAYGLEVDGRLSVTPQFTLSGAFSWNNATLQGTDANITRFFLNTAADGARLSQTPELSGNFAADYRGDLGVADLGWFTRLEGIYVGSRYASSLNLAETGDSFDLNLRFGLENDRYSASIFVENLTQDKTFESLRSNADCATNAGCPTRANEVVLPNRRQFGIKFAVKM